MTVGASRRKHVVVSALSVVGAVAAHLWLQAGMMTQWEAWRPNSFRNYFAFDQLAYLGIVTDVSLGESWQVEPYTLTGANHYPRAWYVLLGTVSRLTGASPASLWTFGGLAVQALLVAAVGTACILLSRRAWTGLLGFVPVLIGTGAWLTSGGETWMTMLDSHAVLWGPFAVLFTLNGETVALSLGGTALLAVLVTAAGRVPRRAAWPVVVSASLVVGALANIQTYSFLTSTFLLAAATAAVAIVRERAWRALALSAGLVVVPLVAGPAVADAVSPLATLALGLLPTLPGLWVVARLTRWRVLWSAGAVALGALPQVASTVLGLAGGDPFLVYREASSKDLGVPLGQGLTGAVAMLALMTLVVVAGVVRRRTLWVAVPSAFALTGLLLATNDRWGANQEPYRFWLDTFVLSAIVLVPLVTWVASDALRRSATEAGPADRPVGVGDGADRADAADGAADDHAPRLEEWTRRSRRVLVGGLAASVVVTALWSWDFVPFRSSVTSMGVIPLYGQQYVAQRELADRTDGSLVLPDACIDPAIFKATWGGPVAFYHLGLAWPTHRDALDEVIDGRSDGWLDPEDARDADVGWILRDPGCLVDVTDDLDATLVGTYPVEGGGFRELWRIDD